MGHLGAIATRVDDDPSARVFIEVYRDERAFAAHEAQPYVQHFLLEREPMIRALRVERLRALD
jgi:quinol monooxygenase YgiN